MHRKITATDVNESTLPHYTRNTVRLTRLWLALAVILFTACASPYVYPPASGMRLPQLAESTAIMEDGYSLPLRYWNAVGNMHAVVLALHGLNDYSSAFDSVGRYLSRRGITVIAYDQRGFGNTTGRGLWHGGERLGNDLITMTGLVHERYTGIPLYLLGESMGGAVVLSSAAAIPHFVDGVILLAPAVWTRDTMPFYQRYALWLAAHTLPGMKLTGKGLDVKASDNIEMLKALAHDDRVIKATRVDVLYGIANLMDNAMTAARELSGNILLLYGKHDQIIPAQPTCELFGVLSTSSATHLTTIVYEHGYHMLTRDQQAAVVLEETDKWIEMHDKPERDSDGMYRFCSGLETG